MADIPTPVTDLAACRATLSGGSRSFWVASQLLPASLKADACGLYAFCREADDLIDDGMDTEAALATLKQRLDAVYAGKPQRHAADRVLAQIVEHHGLPRAPLDALLEGFAWDNSGRRYANMAEVMDYAARVAGSVGILMALLMGTRDGHALARAADLGVAMQLTNIVRDIGEDARNGRLYLPEDAVLAAGIDIKAFTTQPAFTPALIPIIETLLDQADQLYARAEHGLASLPPNCRRGIYAARLLYAEIGHNVRRMGYNSVDKRSVIGMWAKLQIALRASLRTRWPDQELQASVLPGCLFLVDAAEGRHRPDSAPSALAQGSLYARMVWMLDALAELEQRDSLRTP